MGSRPLKRETSDIRDVCKNDGQYECPFPTVVHEAGCNAVRQTAFVLDWVGKAVTAETAPRHAVRVASYLAATVASARGRLNVCLRAQGTLCAQAVVYAPRRVCGELG